MKNQLLKRPVEIWIKEDFIIPESRPIPLLMHMTPLESDAEVEFWNLLREKLPKLVQVHKFKDLADAGPLVVTPHHIKDYMFANKLASVCEFNRQVLASGRTIVTFSAGMDYKPQQGEIVFASSTYRCKTEKSISMPPWLYDVGTKISPIQKPSVPTVGFVGDTEYPGLLNSLLRYVPITDSIRCWLACSLFVNRSLNLRERRVIARLVRQKVIKEARRAPNLKTSVIERKNGFFKYTEEEKKRHRAEYIQSIQNNAYTICMRGDNNDNFQLYEVMSAGRIPVIIDTKILLPDLGGFGKWEDFCVIVPFSDVHRIGDIVQAFHNRMSDEDFRQVCLKSRAAFEYLLPHNFIEDVLRFIGDAMKDKLPVRV